MSGGSDLLGAPPAEPRKRGRPKGSTNKRSADLKGYVSAKFGGSAAQQMAALCMVTPAEVRKHGGVLEARVAKARELAQALDIKLAEAFQIISRELQALAPYTDQRQPLAVEQVGDGFRPAVVVMGAAPGQAAALDLTGEFRVVGEQVSQPKSHEQGQVPDLLELLPPEPSAGE
jgi:hypothetical protein